jgi:hypothetical protein
LPSFESLGVDCVGEDFNRSERARATGFVGKSSELTWIQRLEMVTDQATRQQDSQHSFHLDLRPELSSTRMPPNKKHEKLPIMSFSYHLDDIGVSPREIVDPHGVPSEETANMLLEAYLTSVHPSFPILGKITFMSQYRMFYDQPSLQPGDKWLAVLNLVFAIAAKYSYMVRTDWKDGERDHLKYFTRARALGINEETLFDHPDLQQVQVEGLTAFYLLTAEQVNRYIIFKLFR